MKTNIKRIASVLLALAMVAALSATLFASALEDGAYLVSRTTSYANPETGKTVDGGTDIALGDSMCASIVDDKVLVEKVGDQYYVTLGIGLMSNITNVRMQVQTKNGGYKSVAVTKTGSCTRDDDTCNHYRFPVEDPNKLISPIFYVTPMGRDVQFFVKLNMSSATKGTGNFAAQMVGSNAKASAPTKAKSAVTTKAAVTKTAGSYRTTAAPEEVTEEVQESGNYSAETKAAGLKFLTIFGIVIAALVVLISAIMIIRHKRN